MGPILSVASIYKGFKRTAAVRDLLSFGIQLSSEKKENICALVPLFFSLHIELELPSLGDGGYEGP